MKRITRVTFLIILLLVVVFPGYLICQALRQEQLDHALIASIKRNDLRAVHQLLNDGASANSRDAVRDERPLWRILLDRIRGQTVPDSASRSALFVALDIGNRYGRTDIPPVGFIDAAPIVQALLAHGADCRARAERGRSLVLVAAQRQEYATLRLLIAHDADLSDRHETELWAPLHYAAADANPATAEALLRKGAIVDARTSHGDTSLMFAALSRNARTVECLLKHGAAANARTVDGEIPLSYAAMGADLECVKLLCRTGVDINANASNTNGTPLMCAVGTNRLPVVRFLLDRGADPNISRAPYPGSRTRDSPLAIAKRNHSAEMIAVLKKAGAK